MPTLRAGGDRRVRPSDRRPRGLRQNQRTACRGAFEVGDSLQGHGIGTLLLGQLAGVAARHGITEFTASVMSANDKMLDVFSESGFPVQEQTDAGISEIRMPTLLSEATFDAFERRGRQPRWRLSQSFFARAPSPSSVRRDDRCPSGRRSSETSPRGASVAPSTLSTTTAARSRGCRHTDPCASCPSPSIWPSLQFRPRASRRSPASARTPACERWWSSPRLRRSGFRRCRAPAGAVGGV